MAPISSNMMLIENKGFLCGCRYHCLQEVNSYVIQKTNQTVYDMALFVFARVAVPLMPVFHQHQHQLCLLRQFCFVFINIERFLVFTISFWIFFSLMHSRRCVQLVTLLITSTFESLFLLCLTDLLIGIIVKIFTHQSCRLCS